MRWIRPADDEPRCKDCALRYDLVKLDYSGRGCKHTKMDGYICMAVQLDRVAYWMVGISEESGKCECYTPIKGESDG